ncbi:hypothetical protein RP20_CCG015683 [Aedes albopictus]|nr:hypothetical protein RP20_CCG015683 [Aedes albopictus]
MLGNAPRNAVHSLVRFDTRAQSREKMLDDANENDAFVNNVGIGHEATYFDAIPIESHERLSNVNINAAVLMSRIVQPQMKRRSRDLVINISSLYMRNPAGAHCGATDHRRYHAAIQGSLLAEVHQLASQEVIIIPPPSPVALQAVIKRSN